MGACQVARHKHPVEPPLPLWREDTAKIDLGLPLDTAAYPFLHWPANQIEYPEALAGLWQQLQDLERQKEGQVRILHLGDSHVQADFWSGTTRQLLQQRFGDAGMGLVFPYRLAGLYGPRAYRFSSTSSWQSRWRTFDSGNALRTGISGAGLHTAATGFTLDYQTTVRRSRYDSGFNCITLFYEKDRSSLTIAIEKPDSNAPLAAAETAPPARYHRVRSGESYYSIARKYRIGMTALKTANGARSSLLRPGQQLRIPMEAKNASTVVAKAAGYSQVGQFSTVPDSAQPFWSILCLEQPLQHFRLRGIADRPGQRGATIYGVLLENTSRGGLLYASAGINGATFYHYNTTGNWLAQLPGVDPDLLIVSLGTNEAALVRFPTGQVAAAIDTFFTRLRRFYPTLPVLITANPDFLRNKVGINPNAGQMRTLLRAKAQQYRAAWWDWYDLMGGSGSMVPWRQAGLAQQDGIHFTQRGYQLQGQLLAQAILTAYQNRNRLEAPAEPKN